jgi:sugar/nucleoside kinase (ribokinase family)
MHQSKTSVAFSHVVIDEIMLDGERLATAELGGAGTYAAMGQALAWRDQGEAVLVSGVGDDFPPEFREALRASGVSDRALVSVHPLTPRTVLHYRREHERAEKPVLGDAHFANARPRAQWLDPAMTPTAVYLFARVDEDIWEDVEQFITARIPLTWEVDVASCDRTQLDAVLRRGSNGIALSLNQYELGRLAGLSKSHSLDDLVTAACNLAPSFGLVALRLGSAGALIVTRDGTVLRASPQPGDVVDTTGAGNAFTGALSVAWAVEDDVDLILKRAMAAAAVTIRQYGPSLPLTDELRAEYDAIATSIRVVQLNSIGCP